MSKSPLARAAALILLASALALVPLALQAGPVVVPAGMSDAGPPGELVPFGAGSPAKAAEVNHNFKVLAGTSNDHDVRIAALEAVLDELKTAAVFQDISVRSISFVGGGTLDSTKVVALDALIDRSPGPRSVRVFTQSGTWNRPPDVRWVWVRMVGGGGGGGGGTGYVNATTAVGYSGGGGGGGGYSEGWLDVTGPATLEVVVGAGGSGSVSGNMASSLYFASVPSSGGSGGSSSFGSVSASGGGGGVSAYSGSPPAPGGPGGSGLIQGQAGWPYTATNSNSGIAPGGASALGFSGQAYGVGGSGAPGNGPTGTPGAPGVVIVWEYE